MICHFRNHILMEQSKTKDDPTNQVEAYPEYRDGFPTPPIRL